MKILQILLISSIFIFFAACGNNSSNTDISKTNIKSSLNTISGVVEDDPVSNAEVYIDFGDGTTSTKATTKSDGSFEIELSDEDLAKINPEVPEGADAPIDDLLIVAKKDGRILRNAISRDINNTGTVYITNDTEAYAEFLESVGAFETSALLSFNDELQNGHIKNSSKYATLIKDLRENVKDYFYNGNQLTKKAIFEKALQDLNKSELAAIADDNSILPVRNIVSGGDIILPEDVNVSSDDITITPKGNGRYTLGDGNDPDETVYLEIAKSDGTFALVPVNIKSKQVIEIANRTITPTEKAELGNDSEGVKVIIPPFALNKATNITIKKIESEGESVDGKKILDLEPHGIQFQVPITIKINYADFGIDDPYAVQWKYGSLDEGYDDADIVSVDTANKAIYLNVDHFSDLVVKKINGDDFLDLGPNFIVHSPRRNSNAVFANYKSKLSNITTIIGNKLFLGDSLNNRAKESYTGFVGGGQCVQTARTIDAILLNGNFPKDNANTNFNKFYNIIKSNKSFEQKVAEIKPYLRLKFENIKFGDVVYFYYSGDEYGHTVLAFKPDYITDSNAIGKKDIGFGTYSLGVGKAAYGLRFRPLSYTIHFNPKDPTGVKNLDFCKKSNWDDKKKKCKQYSKNIGMWKKYFAITYDENKKILDITKQNWHYIVFKREAFENTLPSVPRQVTKYHVIYWTPKFKNPVVGWFTYDEIKKNFDWSQIAKKNKNISNPKTYGIDVYREDGRRYCSKKKNLKSGTYAHGYDKCYSENTSLEDFLQLAASKTVAVGNERKIAYETVDESYNEKPYLYYLVSKIGDGITKVGNIYKYNPDLLPVAPLRIFYDNGVGQIQNYEDARYEIYAEYKNSATFKTSDGINLKYSDTNITLPRAFGNNIKLTRLVLTQDSNKTSLLMIANNFSRNIKVSGISSPIKMLFSPIVIDDYYVNWGKDNKNHNIPIGFWNSKGYNLEYEKFYLLLEANKIYKSENAVNGYFMTLGKGERAEWHFALAGPHSIFVNVPTGRYADIKNAKYILHLGDKTLELAPSGNVEDDAGIKVKGSAFENWFYLKSKDGNISFNLTGKDYLEVQAKDGIVVVDAIRLEGLKNRIEKIKNVKGQPNLSIRDDVKYFKCLLKACNTSTQKCVEKIVPFGVGFVLHIPASLTKQVNLEFTYSALPKNMKKNNNRALMRTSNETNDNLAMKYKPVIQNITINPDETTKIIPPVTLQPYGTKESIKLHLINAVDGSAIKDANVTIRYGIDNDNNESIAYSGVTDENGYFEIENMPYGQYTAVFSKDGFISTSLNMKVDEDSNDVYDLSMSPALAQGEMRIRLSWGENPSDLDSHLVKYVNGKQEYHIYYVVPTGTNGDNLDLDDTDGYGPETVTIKEVNVSAKYIYFVHKYAGSGDIKNSGASVKVSYGNSEQTFYPPQEDGRYWKVFTIENGTIIPCISNCMSDRMPVLGRVLGRIMYLPPKNQESN